MSPQEISIKVKGSQGVSFKNFTQNAGAAAEGKAPPAVRVLFLAANPAETTRLRVDREARAIDEALRASGLRDCFELEQSWAVSDADLQDHLLRYEPAVVHLSGHGSRAGQLVLDSDPLSRDLVTGGPGEAAHSPDEAVLQAMARLFSAAAGSARCVLLNACHSAAQAQQIAEHVDCAIGMSGPIGDDSAIRFSRAFYGALGYGQSLQSAFDLGCAQITLGGGAGAPRLFALRVNPADLVLVRRDS